MVFFSYAMIRRIGALIMVLSLVALLVSQTHADPSSSQESQVPRKGMLEPHKLLQHQDMALGSSVLYGLQGLAPNNVYTIRLSYPSSEPTIFSIALVDLTDDAKASRSSPGSRGLRDTAIGM